MTTRSRLGYLAAIITLIFGLGFLVAPYWAILLLGFEFSTARPWGVSELRATYGAAVTALGGVMLWALPLRPRTAPYLRLAGTLWLAAASGRFLSLLLDGATLPLNIAALVLELFVGSAALIAAAETRSRSVPPAGLVRREP
jgi:hypothetical protein